MRGMMVEENTLDATKNEEFAGESIPFEGATGRPKRKARKPARYCCRNAESTWCQTVLI